MPYKSAVIARSKQIGLDPSYVYGLIRQESRFIMDATKSGVGASGLMQVMPATAKWTAKKIGLNDFQPQQINDRDTNIAIGTGYLKLVLDALTAPCPWPPPPTTPAQAAPQLARAGGAHPRLRPPSGPKTCRLPRPAITSKRCWPMPPTMQR